MIKKLKIVGGIFIILIMIGLIIGIGIIISKFINLNDKYDNQKKTVIESNKTISNLLTKNKTLLRDKASVIIENEALKEQKLNNLAEIKKLKTNSEKLKETKSETKLKILNFLNNMREIIFPVLKNKTIMKKYKLLDIEITNFQFSKKTKKLRITEIVRHFEEVAYSERIDLETVTLLARDNIWKNPKFIDEHDIIYYHAKWNSTRKRFVSTF